MGEIDPPTMEAQDLGLAGVRRVERGMGAVVADGGVGGGGAAVGDAVGAEVVIGAGKTLAVIVVVVGEDVQLVTVEAVASEGVGVAAGGVGVAAGGVGVAAGGWEESDSEEEDRCPELEAKLTCEDVGERAPECPVCCWGQPPPPVLLP